MSLGFWQVLLIGAVIVLVFGTGKLPTIGRDIARGFRNFKDEMKTVDLEAEEVEPTRGASRTDTARLTPPQV